MALRTTAWTHAEAHPSHRGQGIFLGTLVREVTVPAMERSTPPPVSRWTQEPPRTLLVGSSGELGWAEASQPCPHGLPHVHPLDSSPLVVGLTPKY